MRSSIAAVADYIAGENESNVPSHGHYQGGSASAQPSQRASVEREDGTGGEELRPLPRTSSSRYDSTFQILKKEGRDLGSKSGEDFHMGADHEPDRYTGDGQEFDFSGIGVGMAPGISSRPTARSAVPTM